MHILYIHQYFCPPGGSGNDRSLELARIWTQSGHRVTVLTSTAYFPASLRFSGSRKLFEVDGISVLALNVPYSQTMRYPARVAAFLKFYLKAIKRAGSLPRPDIIYASSTPPTVGEMGRRLARRWHVPFVFETVDVWPDVPIGMGILHNRMVERWVTHQVDRIYRDADLVVALSEGMKAQIVRHHVPEQKVVVAYNGTNLQAFPYVVRPGRPELNVIYAGTVGIANDVSVLADLSLLLEKRGVYGVRFTVLGSGNDLSRVKRKVAALGRTNIHFVQSVPKQEVAGHFSQADAGMVTFAPYKVLEANSANKFFDYLASGLPVILNYEGWQAEYLRRHGCGLASPMGDLDALADNVTTLLCQPARRISMGANARKLAEECFDRHRIAADLLRMLEELVCNRRPG
jgi:glycosyltransferase involved in cell wall biosynthesis